MLWAAEGSAISVDGQQVTGSKAARPVGARGMLLTRTNPRTSAGWPNAIQLLAWRALQMSLNCPARLTALLMRILAVKWRLACAYMCMGARKGEHVN